MCVCVCVGECVCVCGGECVGGGVLYSEKRAQVIRL